MIQLRLKYRTTPTNLRTFFNSYNILVKIFCHSVLLISAHLNVYKKTNSCTVQIT